ncbi:zinc finger, CCHC-type containing protein [Tanacetum coccineum]
MFKTHEPSYSMLYMGNHSTAQVKRKGKINLVFTSGNTLTLNDVLHGLNVRKNLVTGSLLNKFSFKLVFESDKFILSKGGKFVGKGYHTGGMFKLNIKDAINSSVNDVNMTEISDANDAFAAPYTPQQNGIAERKNHTLMDMVNSMMSYSGLSFGYWGEALLTACYILYRVPSKRSIKTPYELSNQRTPKLDYIQIWGCRAIVQLPESKKRKLGDKGIECIFLGYAQNSKSYIFIVVEPNDLILDNTIIESRDACFDENRFKTVPMAYEISKETMSTEIPITTEGNNDDSFSDHQQVEPRRSTRQRRQRNFSPDFEMYLVEGDRKEAVNDEMDSITGNNTWILAWLVAKGFTQREGLDYFDTYALVARTTTTRILIALASINKLIIHQMDVKTTFLNGKLEEEVYMEQPKDDMLIFRTDLEQVKMTKKLLSKNFDMKDLGEANVILGIKIPQKENRLMLIQSHYIKKILKSFDSFNCLTVSPPFEVGSKLTYNSARILAQNKYAKVIGSLMYAMTCTRPDIAYAVGRLSRHTSSPDKEHWDAVNQVFKYLKKTMDYGLEYSGDPLVLEGYTNASWITDQEDYASMSGWIFTLGGGAVS